MIRKLWYYSLLGWVLLSFVGMLVYAGVMGLLTEIAEKLYLYGLGM